MLIRWGGEGGYRVRVYWCFSAMFLQAGKVGQSLGIQSPSENGNETLNTMRFVSVVGHPNHHLRI